MPLASQSRELIRDHADPPGAFWGISAEEIRRGIGLPAGTERAGYPFRRRRPGRLAEGVRAVTAFWCDHNPIAGGRILTEFRHGRCPVQMSVRAAVAAILANRPQAVASRLREKQIATGR